MANIKSAKKKVRKDKKRLVQNESYRRSVKKVLKSVEKKNRGKQLKETVRKAIAVIDKAAKKGIIHKNKAARLKSKISKLTS